jgi:penicillin-binding protein 1A
MDVWDTDTQVKYDDTEDVSPDEESPYAETINIDDEPIQEGDVEIEDPLHPKKSKPVVPASRDSGTLF